jgi:hypothetical protein
MLSGEMTEVLAVLQSGLNSSENIDFLKNR